MGLDWTSESPELAEVISGNLWGCKNSIQKYKAKVKFLTSACFPVQPPHNGRPEASSCPYPVLAGLGGHLLEPSPGGLGEALLVIKPGALLCKC